MIELDGYEVLATLVETEAKVLLRARALDSGRAVVVELLQAEHPAPEKTRKNFSASGRSDLGR